MTEQRIETTHPVDTPENAGLLMFAMLHSFVDLAQKYPTAKVERWVVDSAMLALEYQRGPIDERDLGGIKSGFNACMHRDTCRTLLTERDEVRELLADVVRQLDRDNDYGNAPGHGHARPGIWDDDNGELAGKPCAWCALWNRAKASLDTATNRQPPAAPTTEGEPNANGC